jgi:VanZ family protein
MFLSELTRPLRLTLYGLATGVVLYMCLAPSREIPGSQLIWDKAAHSLTWAILTGSGLILAPRRPRAIPTYALALGGVIEVAQATMGFGRQGDWRDFVADSLGVGLAMFIWWAVRSLMARRKPSASRETGT